MSDREQDFRRVLMLPENAEALVAWDRDIEPLLPAHQHYWGSSPGESIWVSLTANGLLAAMPLKSVKQRHAGVNPIPHRVARSSSNVLNSHQAHAAHRSRP